MEVFPFFLSRWEINDPQVLSGEGLEGMGS